MIVVKLLPDNSWWIIPNYNYNDDTYTIDIGPFESYQVAAIYTRLSQDV